HIKQYIHTQKASVFPMEMLIGLMQSISTSNHHIYVLQCQLTLAQGPGKKLTTNTSQSRYFASI
ncbi:MAG: hypothetical protein LGB06_07330, partial [Sulfurovum sp.]|nr:hypothetical protein [Sulfurovum sp.]